MKKIISGGQTGADQGALEAARELGFPYGGWMPFGMRAENGHVPAHFDQLKEHSNPGYGPRTRDNVRDSKGTVIICPTPMTPGSKATLRFCREQNKKAMVRDAALVKADPHQAADQVWDWIVKNEIDVLNVAGTRESKCKGLQAAVRAMVSELILRARERARGAPK
jgi:hypothetical protein